MIRVLLADDQRAVREGLGTLLGLLEGIELVATAADGEEALALAAEHDPDALRAGAPGREAISPRTLERSRSGRPFSPSRAAPRPSIPPSSTTSWPP